MDLHSGGGGFALAARWTGYDTIGFAEIEPYCNDLLAKRFPGVVNYGDVRKFARRFQNGLDATDFPEFYDLSLMPEGADDGADELYFCELCSADAGEPIDIGDCDCVGADQILDEYGAVDAVTSGFPCQDLSRNNPTGKGLDGSRSGLYKETIRITCELGSPFVILENVAALKTKGIDRLASEFEAVGYAFGTVVVPGRAVGAGHLRERVYAVGHATGERMEGLRPERFKVTLPLVDEVLPLRSSDGQWITEPDLLRAVHGVSGGMDRSRNRKQRIDLLGNAIIPQIAAAIFDILPFLAKRGELQLTG